MQNASFGAFCNTFDLHKAIIVIENQFGVLFEWPLKTGFTIYSTLTNFWPQPPSDSAL